jgi:transcriptional regulator with XRE-family HTH domain
MTEENLGLGKTLKKARELKKLTLRKVESLLNISNAYLSQLENDKIAKPSADVIFKLSMLYDIPFDILMMASGVLDEKDLQLLYSQRKLFPKTVEGHSLFSTDLSSYEEKELLKYLNFLRSEK